jgi:dienelactone hydrolase
LTKVAWIVVLWGATCFAEESAPNVTVDGAGTVHVPPVAIPISSLSSDEARQNFLDFIHGIASLAEGPSEGGDIQASRKRLDDRLMRPGAEKLRPVFSVDITPETMGDVPVEVIAPAGGVSAVKQRRVLLRQYPAQNIGIYGCSAGGILSAQAIAWFQQHGLPRAGAIGMFGGGALIPMMGKSNYFGSALSGWPPVAAATMDLPYFDIANLDLRNPLVSPAYSPAVLAGFPPSLLISSTRDVGLSAAAYTHAQLIKAGVDANLYVIEGAPHCSFAQPVVDPRVPETRDAWDVIVKFFDKQLGR